MAGSNKNKTHTNSISHNMLNQTDLSGFLKEDILSVLDGLSGLILERGYGSLFFDGPAAHVREIIGRQTDINIIPGVEEGICCPLALALITIGSSNRYSFRTVMRQVRKHMIDCFNDTGAVLVVTDVWSPRLLEESLLDLDAHESRGRHILFFLVNGRNLIPLERD
jgi:hypothetical protein